MLVSCLSLLWDLSSAHRGAIHQEISVGKLKLKVGGTILRRAILRRAVLSFHPADATSWTGCCFWCLKTGGTFSTRCTKSAFELIPLAHKSDLAKSFSDLSVYLARRLFSITLRASPSVFESVIFYHRSNCSDVFYHHSFLRPDRVVLRLYKVPW